MVNEDGYIKIRVGVGHPLADPNGYAYEHLVVWCAAGNPRPPKGFRLHHKDEHRSNNQIGNLEILPSNREHAARHGTLKLNEGAARDMRIRYAAGLATQAELAAEFGVPLPRVSKVIRGKVWRSAGGPISAGDNRIRDPRTGRVIGKKAAGRLLDGVEHNGFPEVQGC